MTLQIALMLFIVSASLVFLAFEWLPVDVTALGILLLLVVTGLLPADQAFAGFGSDSVIVILGLFILTAALLRTGVVEISGRTILRYTGDNPNRLLVVIMVTAAVLGAFISNTASTAFFVPIVLSLARRAGMSASKLLMPLAFASILTSSVTIISTSTNIVISGLMSQYDMLPMGIFELAPVGIPIAVAGLIYMYTLGRRLIPDRYQDDEHNDDLGIRDYLTEAAILPGSPLAGKTLSESGLGRDLDLTVLRIARGGQRYVMPRPEWRLEVGDVLLLEGKPDEILKIEDTTGIKISTGGAELETEDLRLVEAIVLPRSPLLGRTLSNYELHWRYGLQVLALNRHGETIRRKIRQIPLQTGDILLVQGHPSNIASADRNHVFSVVGALEGHRPNVRRAPVAVIAFVAALTLAALGIALPVAIFLGVIAVFLARAIHPDEAYREVDWRALILIASMLSVGAAMQRTGTAEFIAAQIARLLGQEDPVWLLAAFFLLTIALTQPMSNQAAAAVVVPVAIQTALKLDLNPRTFAMMTAVAASTSYLTPLEPACLMVYGPGRYRFTDFVRVGAVLTLLIFVIAIVLVPIVWPLR